jgi:CelD/BcsL family acetyltransferase involved in cellulose biosynthesis
VTPLVFTAVEDIDTVERLGDEWRGLHARSRYRSVYNSHDFVAACIRGFRDTDIRTLVLTARKDGELVAVFPFQVNLLEYHGARLNVIEYTAPWEMDKPYPVIARGSEEDAWAGLVDYLRRDARRWHRLDLMECRAGLPGPDLLRAGLQRPWYWFRSRPDRKSPVLSLETPWEERWQAHRKMRKKVARMRRDFADRLRFDVTSDSDPCPDLLQAYIDIESRGWKAGRVGIGRDPGATAFYRDLFARLARRGALRFGVLSIDGAPVSIEIAYIDGDTVYFSHGTFDETYASYSPGMVSTCLFLEHFHGIGYVEGDYLAGYAGYMVPWCDRLVESARVSVYRLTPSVLYVFAAKALERLLIRRRGKTGKGAANL